MRVYIQKLHADVELPERKTSGAVGYDVRAYCPEGILIPKGEIQLIPTGLKMALPEGTDLEIRPRSGFSTKTKLLIPNSPGTIDSDYRGEIFIPLFNLSGADFLVEHGARIAQMLLRESKYLEFSLVDSLEDHKTERGSSGFGSTGTH